MRVLHSAPVGSVASSACAGAGVGDLGGEGEQESLRCQGRARSRGLHGTRGQRELTGPSSPSPFVERLCLPGHRPRLRSCHTPASSGALESDSLLGSQSRREAGALSALRKPSVAEGPGSISVKEKTQTKGPAGPSPKPLDTWTNVHHGHQNLRGGRGNRQDGELWGQSVALSLRL